MKSKNIVITGLMGSGKTTVGRLVAEKTGRAFVDTDEYLVSRFGPAKSILDLPNGDQQFRRVEEQVASELSRKTGLVISTGGRFLLNQINIDLMSENGVIVCLQAELNELVERLLKADSDTYRPRFAKAEDKLALMASLNQQSQPFYAQFNAIQTSGYSAAQVAERIIEHCFCPH